MDTQVAPRGFWPTLKQLGPGLIVSGSIVGSGELIATTTLGARVGFAALWLIIVSCLIKVLVQIELGRYSISSGDTSLRALDKVPGPRWRASWVAWAWMFMFIGVTFQQGGIIGGVGQVFNVAFPQLGVQTWAIISSILAAVLLLRGTYSNVERISTILVVSFTFITVACALLLAWTPYAVRSEQLVEGFSFTIPAGGLAVAFAAFGITGVGATELIYYPYWCLEKGYRRFVGPNDHSAAWVERARSWIRVMQIDAVLAMFLYTLATVAFYMLGAGVLYAMGTVPSGYEMVSTLSSMYTSTLGNWALYLFLVGAFFVLFSTTFSATASNSRVVVDFLELIGIIRVQDEDQRRSWRRVMIIGLLVLFVILYSWVGEPVLMVIIGGIAQACMLPIIGFSAIYLRYRRTERALRPQLWVDLLLWLTSSMMLAFALYTLWTRL
ncbi:MAG: Nramp family divalent metal transporter [Acidobacteriota bacterium]